MNQETMKHKEQLLKLLHDFREWTGERLDVMHVLTGPETDTLGDPESEEYGYFEEYPEYRLFIEQIDKDFDSLCQMLFDIAGAIVEHRRLMLDVDPESYLLGHLEASLNPGNYESLSEGEDKCFRRLNFGGYPNPDDLSFPLGAMYEWADDFVNSLNEANTIDKWNSFMVNFDVEFDGFVKTFVEDLNQAIPIFSTPDGYVRPSLLRVDDLMARRHEAPERLQ
jgi:hypothetical protein